MPERLPPSEAPGDFTATARMLPLSALAVGIGVVGAYIATALLALIAFFTNLFFFQRLSLAPASPASHSGPPLCGSVPSRAFSPSRSPSG
jgi:CIC family chloride channel protein